MGNEGIYEKLKHSFQIFSDRTSMHGFNELFYAKYWFWKFAWTIVVFGAIIVTFYQVYESILQYIDSGSLTEITPIEPGGLYYPSASVCYIHWITWIDWKKAYSLKYSKEAILYGMSFISNVVSPTVFDEAKAKKQLSETMALNNISTLTDFYKSVAKKFPLVEGINGGFVVDNPKIFKTIEFRFKNSEIYLCYRMDGQEILDLLGNRSQYQAASRVAGNYFNFSIQDPSYSIYSTGLSYEEYNYYAADWILKKTNYWIKTKSDYKKNYTGFTFPIRLYPDTYDDKYVEIIVTNDVYIIELQPTVHRWLNNKRTVCGVGEKSLNTEHFCDDMCKAKFRRDVGICLALDFALLLGEDKPDRMCKKSIQFLPIIFGTVTVWLNNTNVTMDVYNDTVVEPWDSGQDTQIHVTDAVYRDSEKMFNVCSDACVDPCEIWKYEYSATVNTLFVSIQGMAFKNQTDIKLIYPEESDVLIIVEINAQTWEDFIANVGGLLGVWTGASIISFLQVFYLCCFTECTQGCCYKRKETKQSVGRTIHVAERSSSSVSRIKDGKHQTLPV